MKFEYAIKVLEKEIDKSVGKPTYDQYGYEEEREKQKELQQAIKVLKEQK